MISHAARRRAVVTGASSGIGAAIATRFARRGYDLVLISNEIEDLARVRDRLDRPERHAVVEADLREENVVTDHIAPAVGTQAFDVLVNCAGAGIYRPFLDTTEHEMHQLMRLNYFAPAELSRLVLPGMIERGRGHIVNVCSVSAVIGPWGHSCYAPAKAAMLNLTEVLAGEYEDCGVHFSVIHPGIIKTRYFSSPETRKLWPRVAKHAIEPDRVARAVERLLDRPRLYAIVPRHYGVLSMLAAFAPKLAHRLVNTNSRPVPEPSTIPETRPAGHPSRSMATPAAERVPAERIPLRG